MSSVPVTFLQFAAATVISYLGLLAGFFLASVTTEELPTGKKYFPLLQRMIILVIGATAANFFGVGTVPKLLFYLVLIAVIMFSINIRLFYAVFGVLLFTVAASVNILLIMSSFIFLFGLVSGSEYFTLVVKKKRSRAAAAGNLLLRNAAYPTIALAMFLLSVR